MEEHEYDTKGEYSYLDEVWHAPVYYAEPDGKAFRVTIYWLWEGRVYGEVCSKSNPDGHDLARFESIVRDHNAAPGAKGARMVSDADRKLLLKALDSLENSWGRNEGEAQAPPKEGDELPYLEYTLDEISRVRARLQPDDHRKDGRERNIVPA